MSFLADKRIKAMDDWLIDLKKRTILSKISPFRTTISRFVHKTGADRLADNSFNIKKEK